MSCRHERTHERLKSALWTRGNEWGRRSPHESMEVA